LDTLNILVADPQVTLNSWRLHPRNAAPGDSISITIFLEKESDNYNMEVHGWFIDASNNTIIDTIKLYREAPGSISYHGQWLTPACPLDYRIKITAEDSLGMSFVDSASIAFTTKPVPDGSSDVLLVGNYYLMSDSSLNAIQETLSAWGNSCDVWNTHYRGECYFTLLEKYIDKVVIWQPTCINPNDLLSIEYDQPERYMMKRFLDLGGRLLIIQSNFAGNVGLYDEELVDAYLSYTYVESIKDCEQLIGYTGDPITNGLTVQLQNHIQLDVVDPIAPAIPILHTPDGRVAGFRISNEEYHTVFLCFSLQNIVKKQTRSLLIGRCADWLRSATSKVDEKTILSIPTHFALFPNYPNPFNPQTVIRYQIPKTSEVTMIIFDVLGHKVSSLVEEKTTTPGTYEIIWDGIDEKGRQLANGIYFCRMNAGSFKAVQKLIMIK